MERGSDKQGRRMDEKMKEESQAVETAMKESHSEEHLEKEQTNPEEETGSAPRVAGTGSSADSFSYKDRGEEGGASHPMPKDPEERTKRPDRRPKT